MQMEGIKYFMHARKTKKLEETFQEESRNILSLRQRSCSSHSQRKQTKKKPKGNSLHTVQQIVSKNLVSI